MRVGPEPTNPFELSNMIGNSSVDLSRVLHRRVVIEVGQMSGRFP